MKDEKEYNYQDLPMNPNPSLPNWMNKKESTMKQHTQGEVRIDKEENHSYHLIGSNHCAICTVYCDPLDEEAKANIELIAEAFQVLNQSGLSPSELLEENSSQRSALALSRKTNKELDDYLFKCIKHIETLGHVIRSLDESSEYNEYWTLDGEYTLFTNEIKRGLPEPSLFKEYIELSAENEILTERVKELELLINKASKP